MAREQQIKYRQISGTLGLDIRSVCKMEDHNNDDEVESWAQGTSSEEETPETMKINWNINESGRYREDENEKAKGNIRLKRLNKIIFILGI